MEGNGNFCPILDEDEITLAADTYRARFGKEPSISFEDFLRATVNRTDRPNKNRTPTWLYTSGAAAAELAATRNR